MTTENEDIEKARLLRDLAGAFDRSLTRGALRLMLRALEDVKPEQLEKAAISLMRTHKWMPTVAELREYLDNVGEEWDGGSAREYLAADVKDWFLEKGEEKVTQERIDDALRELGEQPGRIKPSDLE